MRKLPSYAVLFKAHSWDDFVGRQFLRLISYVGVGDLFLVLDETHHPIPDIPFGRVIRQTEAMVAAGGYLNEPAGNLFWHNTDYQMYHFMDHFPQFDYIITIEYDCAINLNLDDLIRTMQNNQIDFVGEKIRTQNNSWNWAEQVKPFYPENLEIQGRLLCFSAYSRSFALQLQAARRKHTSRRLTEQFVSNYGLCWPNNEGFVGAEIVTSGVKEMPLSAFADVSRYDWAPAHAESSVTALTSISAVHPVLDKSRYFKALSKVGWKPVDIFEEGSPARRHVEEIAIEELVQMFLQSMATENQWENLPRLKAYVEKRVGKSMPELFDVALGRPATQSSVSPWSHFQNVAQDAAGAVTGRLRYGYSFHTHIHEPSWWCVDLQAPCPVREIRIHNRVDLVERAQSLVVSSSIDMIEWQLLYRHSGGPPFGAEAEAALIVSCDSDSQMRFLKLHLEERELLHLGEVQALV